MKILLSILLYISITISNLQGNVRFEFSYDDAPGVGFNDPVNQAFKDGIEEAGHILGSCLDHQATIQISVKELSDIEGYHYASIVAQHVKGEIVSFPSIGIATIGSDGQVQTSIQILKAVECHNVVHKKIMSGEDLNGLDVEDANLVVNLQLKNILSFTEHNIQGKVDFVAIIMHELTHALGFCSLVDSSLGIGFQYINHGEICYTAFDKYLIDQTHSALVEDYLFNHDIYDFYSVLHLSSPGKNDVHYFNGPHAKEANSDNPIPINTGHANMDPDHKLMYSYEGGMAHIDTLRLESECTLAASPFENHITTHMMQKSTNRFHEELPRHWSLIEQGILKDLGYKIKGDTQEDSNVSWNSWLLSWY